MKSIKQDVVRNIKSQKIYMVIGTIITLSFLSYICFDLLFFYLTLDEFPYDFFFGTLGAWLFFMTIAIFSLIHEFRRLNGELEDIQRRIENHKNQDENIK